MDTSTATVKDTNTGTDGFLCSCNLSVTVHAKRSDHVSPLLHKLHWLSVYFRIEFIKLSHILQGLKVPTASIHVWFDCALYSSTVSKILQQESPHCAWYPIRNGPQIVFLCCAYHLELSSSTYSFLGFIICFYGIAQDLRRARIRTEKWIRTRTVGYGHGHGHEHAPGRGPAARRLNYTDTSTDT